MSKNFVEGIKTPFAKSVSEFKVQTRDGLKTFNYLPWALALALADCPDQEVYEHNGELYVEVFGGCVVGVVEKVGESGAQQVTWLPVLNGANQAMPVARVTSRDLSDTINRCRAKAVAMVNGVGLALYAKGETNVVSFIRALDVKPDTNLRTASPVIAKAEEKHGEFIDWPHAVAAARLTDPDFLWEVVFKDVVDKTSGEIQRRPYYRMGSGYGVAVRVTYKGKTHTEYLPVMGFDMVDTSNGKKRLDHQPLVNPDCHDWNRSVMRCLVKAIAVVSGYGLNVYAKADVEELNVDPLPRKESAPEAPPAPEPPPEDPKAKAELIEQVEKALKASGREAVNMLTWLGYKETAVLADASMADLEKALKALSPPRKAVAS